MKRIDIKKTPLLGVFLVSGRRGSNSQQPAWKAGTLPIELLPHKIHYSIVKLPFDPTILTQNKLYFKLFYYSLPNRSESIFV